MRALILEDDDLLADLLETVVAGLYPGARVRLSGSLVQAREYLDQGPWDLFIVDWNLPDGSGLDLVRQVRRSDPEVPVVMVTARSDRDSVLMAAHYGIDGYITKPFDVHLLHDRLSRLLKIDIEVPQSLARQLETSLEQVILLPSDVNPAEILDLMNRQEELSPAQLAERWREQPGLTTRLLDVANSSSFRRSGNPVVSLRDAIASLGVALSLNQVLAQSLDVAGKLQDASLKSLASAHHAATLQVAQQARVLALRLNKEPAPFQQAGLLSRLGELAVLRVLNQYVITGGELEDGEAVSALSQWSQAYGNRLKVQWRLPLGLRELIGSVHSLPGDCTREDRLVMRAAALIAAGQQDTGECQRLLRRIGLDPENRPEEQPHGP